jgi:TonB-dependent SusC/RagA subfamily outer membrane receptor
MEEVVVVGYGTQKRKDLTGSVASVSEKDFADMPVTRLDEAIAGRIPGLDILSSGGRPGDPSTMLLRGQRSFTASNDPLIILDGMPFYGTMNDINPYDVKTIDVLKDASSTAIYGSRGANGVIIITSKRGLNSAPKFRLESYAGSQVRYGRLPYANGREYAAWGREAFRAQPGGYPYPDINPRYDSIIFDAIELKTVLENGLGLDYQDLVLQNGNQQKHQFTITGGSEAVKYNFSANYFKQEGILPDDIFNRMSIRSNLDFVLSPNFRTVQLLFWQIKVRLLIVSLSLVSGILIWLGKHISKLQKTKRDHLQYFLVIFLQLHLEPNLPFQPHLVKDTFRSV